MSTEAEITHKLFKDIKSDRTIMLAIANSGSDSQPMTAVLDGDADSGPLWIFSAANVDLVQSLAAPQPGAAQFVSKGHDVFATLTGRLTLDNDRAVIDRLWNPFIAAWYKGGKDDPTLRLIRFDLDHAHVWLNENSAFAMVKLMLGSDPKKDYRDKVADIAL